MSFLRWFRHWILSEPQRQRASSADPSRRSFLQAIGWGTALPVGRALARHNSELPRALIDASRLFDDQVNLSLYRYQDLLQLDLSFSGFKLSGDNKNLVRSASDALLVVYFQPQHLAEQAYRAQGGGSNGANFDAEASKDLGEAPPAGNDGIDLPAATYASDRSRLVFEIPAAINNIPLTADALLNWGQLTPVINNRATAEAILPIFSGKDNVADYLNVLAAPPAEPVKAPSRKQLRAATKDEQAQMNARVVQNQQMTLVNPKNVKKSQRPLFTGIIKRLTPGKTPRPLDPSETSIELPYRLFISPNQFGSWYHELKLKWTGIQAAGAFQSVELWHNRLTASNGAYMTVRALWGVDINGTYSKKPTRDESFITALYNDDRHCIVHESSNWGIANYSPQAIQVEQLMLTPLGGWLDGVLQVSRTALSNAKIIGSLNLLKWKHLATLARDHYVEVVYAGNIFPFGHEASLVRVTQRTAKLNYAFNQQIFFIVINETEKKYNPIDNNQFNSFPFSTIRFVTSGTPPLTPPQRFCTTLADKQDDHQFIPKVNGIPFLFRIIAYDLEGTEVDLEMPLVFVSTDITVDGHGNANTGNINAIIQLYNDVHENNISTQIDLRSQKMALTRSQTPGDARFEAQSATFHAAVVPGPPPGFRPLVAGMEVFIHAVQAITGVNTAQQVVLVDDRNKGTVFASLVTASPVNFNGNSNKTGGSLSPNFAVTAISKLQGAIGGDVGQAQNLSFDPSSFFDNTAKLFGVIDLGKIVQKVASAAASLNGVTVNSPIPALKTIETADALITQYTWNAASLTSYDFGFVQFQPASTAPGSLVVETSLYRYKNASQPDTLVVNSYIDNFTVTIAGLAAVGFKRVGFTTGSHAKVDVTVDLEQPPVKFLGALTFVNTLQQFIPANGFSDPPYLDVSDTGVETGYTLALPNIQLGIFTLSNVSFGANVDLPFTGDPMTLNFNFCQKQQPFTLTVSLLGGGGFFAVAFDMHGLQSLEAALEFGAAASLDLGVASGSISVMGGVYYAMTIASGVETSELSGYVRMNGSLSVLGLITASVEFDLTLAADLSGSKVKRVWGEASLTIQVSVFMFSTSVQLQVEREFAGADADPTFGQMVSQSDWQTYCGAFAA